MNTNFESSDSLPNMVFEDSLTQECKNLISSLPSETGWIADKIYQYQGFWYQAKVLQQILNLQQHFQARDSDVILVTNPKCGTTWLKALAFALVCRGKFHNSPDHPLLSNNPHLLVPLIELSQWYGTGKTDFLSTLLSTRLLATHMPHVSLPESMKNESCKIVYLWRDPKDVLVSFWQYRNRMRTKEMGSIGIEEAFDKFCKGITTFGPFWEHVLGYWKASLEHPNKFLFLRYEEMKEQPRTQLKRLADFMGYKFSDEEEANASVDEILKLCSFDSLSNIEVNKRGNLPTGIQIKVFFRKGEVGDWRNHLTPEMAQTIDQITERNLGGLGFKF